METFRVRYQSNPAVREFTVSILGQVGQNDKAGQIRACNEWVKSHVTYVNDPEGVEYLTSPLRFIDKYMRGEQLFGDCDCHCLLLGSMLGSLGFIIRFVGVKMAGTDDFNHVVVGVENDTQLQLVDPCAKREPQHDYQELLLV